MVFAPVDPMIKEKIIAAHLAGHGRNQIDREMAAQGIKVSHGSITNIINAYKRKREAPSPPEQQVSSGSNDAGISTAASEVIRSA